MYTNPPPHKVFGRTGLQTELLPVAASLFVGSTPGLLLSLVLWSDGFNVHQEGGLRGVRWAEILCYILM